MVPVTFKWIELAAWHYRNAESKEERAEIVRWVFVRAKHNARYDAVRALARLLGVSAARLAREANLDELRRQMNRWRRGRGKKPRIDPYRDLREHLTNLQVPKTFQKEARFIKSFCC
ncbi:hypothetical protein [Desulfovirgula thermocuniculi]|uniref:hypothetical protein n=1 Tax=Desulfovirgula thermocuniculi TaxID=348842 RepID=UPI000406C253|nr:hypothetical protein [Desulfovirgula thermocuniculi]